MRGLQEKGLIEIKQNESEKSKKPMLTPNGANLLKQALTVVEEADRDFFSSLKNRQSAFLKDLNSLI